MAPAVDGDVEQQHASSNDEEGRTASMWTAAAHILTAVIGSGVLALPWSVAQLGWIAGLLTTLSFALVTYYASILLADCYRSPSGVRSHDYMSAVGAYLSGTQVWLCAFTQYSQLVAITISYIITSATSMGSINSSVCFHKEGTSCSYPLKTYMLVFAAVQLLFAHIPNVAGLAGLSTVATVTSFVYCLAGLGLSIALALRGHHDHDRGTIAGVSASPVVKTFQVFQALGNIAFAYSFSVVLIEIQDTLKSRPPENVTMKKATFVGTLIATAFYMSVSAAGYSAFGNDAPGNLLTGFQQPFWLVIMANLCLVVHLTGAYQICSQPIYARMESIATSRWPKCRLFRAKSKLTICGRTFTISWWKVAWRNMYVIATAFIAMLIPFFNDLVGLIGAFGFWPLTVYFPMKMYMKRDNIRRWSTKWILLQLMSLTTLVISVAAAAGSLYGIIQDSKSYSPFG